MFRPVREIDVRHLGTPRVICCLQLDDAIVDPGPGSTVTTLLEALGDEPPARILLTHIHLDHAGGAGALVQRWPDVEVWVHERGARHVLDPSRLVASARTIYGEDMERLWGEMLPVPEANLRVLSGGERIGPWRVEYTPGHAWHHVSYLHEPTGTAYVGDVAGAKIDGGPLIPPTPAPDVDLEAWHASLRTVAGWDPARVVVTHFGTFEDVGAHLEEVHAALDHWGALGREVDDAAYQKAVIEAMRRTPDPEAIDSYLQASPPGILWAGLHRYWTRREAA
jgi:glyoxylase-like metal-dependent hydrolase (beta-lactamase superfamily II)